MVLLYTEGSFIKQFPLDQRKAESKRIRERYPDRVPVIVERAAQTTLPPLDRRKFLVPAELTMGQFAYVIRKRIKLSPEKSMYVMCNNELVTTSREMHSVYNSHKSDDGFLYVVVSEESTFGG